MEMGKWMAGLRSAAPPLVAAFSTALVLVSAEKGLPEQEHHLLARVVNYLWRPDDSSYHHVWPVKQASPPLFSVVFSGAGDCNSFLFFLFSRTWRSGGG